MVIIYDVIHVIIVLPSWDSNGAKDRSAYVAHRSQQEGCFRAPLRAAGSDRLAGDTRLIRDYLAQHGVTYIPSGMDTDKAEADGNERPPVQAPSQRAATNPANAGRRVAEPDP